MRYAPAFLAALLLGAHFLRSGNLALVALSFSIPIVALIPHERARIAARVLLVLGALEWVRTTVVLVEIRNRIGEPWGRMVLILGAVAAVTALAAVVLPKVAPRPDCPARM